MCAINPISAGPPARSWRLPQWSGRAAVAAVVALLAGCGGSSPPGVAHVSSTTTSAGGGARPVSGPRSAVAFAACMRSHGVPGFPDPGSNGHLGLGNGVDPSSAQFHAAQKDCRSLLPAGGSSFFSQGAGRLSPHKQAQLLRFARCMRAHGVPSFPDPTSQGIALSAGVDPKSPQFQAATQACRQLAPALGQGGGQTVAAGSGGGL